MYASGCTTAVYLRVVVKHNELTTVMIVCMEWIMHWSIFTDLQDNAPPLVSCPFTALDPASLQPTSGGGSSSLASTCKLPEAYFSLQRALAGVQGLEPKAAGYVPGIWGQGGGEFTLSKILSMLDSWFVCKGLLS